MTKAYTRQYPDGFKNKPDKSTPITAEVMTAIDAAIDELDDRVVELSGKSGGGCFF